MNSVYKKFESFFTKRSSMRLFLISVSVFVIAYVMKVISMAVYDTDVYFLIATGREILLNGILYENPWTVDAGQSFIAQQWLYDVIIAIADRYSYPGLVILFLIQYAVFVIIVLNFFRIKGLDLRYGIAGILFVSYIGQMYVFSLRPELVTLILLMSECLVFEHYRKHKRVYVFAALPVLMVLEMNMHMSMWPVHFLIVAAYMVPSFHISEKDDVKVFHRDYPAVIVSTMAMIPVMIMNPYGMDGILYIIDSFRAKTFDHIKIVEMQETSFLSYGGMMIFIAIALFFICCKVKHISHVTVNMTAGFVILSMFRSRNMMFLTIAYLFLFTDLMKGCQDIFDKIDWKKNITRMAVLIMFIGDILMVGITVRSFIGMAEYREYMTTSVYGSIYDSIMQDYDPDMRIFTGIDTGGFLEYMGLENIYIDARPELYTDVFTGDKNILKDYGRYCVSGYDMDDVSHVIDKKDMDAWFDPYDFDYVIVCPFYEIYLHGYITMRDDYELIEDAGDVIYRLYKKKR